MTGLAERDGSVAEPLAQVAPARSALAAWAKPLRVHLSVVIVALLIAISAPLMWLTYSQGTREAIDAAESQMRLLSQQATSLYEAMLSDGASVVKMASVLPSMAAEPPAFLDAKKAFMMEALKGSVHLDGVYAGYPGGSFVQLIDVERNERWRHDVAAPAATAFAMRIVLRTAQGVTSTWQFLDRAGAVLDERVTADASYDPRRRPWYRAGLGAPGPVSLGPYVSASTNSLTYSVAMPMAADPAIVLGADVLIETIGHLLAERAVSENAVGFAFDDDGTLIAHSDPQVMARLVDSYLGAARADASAEGHDPMLAAVRGLLAGGREDGIVEFDVAGSPYLARLSSTATSGLLDGNRIVVAAPLADFTAESIRLVQKTVAIAAVLVLAGVLVALALARLISRALVALADDARHIGNLDFQGAPVRHSWISEINLLAGALGFGPRRHPHLRPLRPARAGAAHRGIRPGRGRARRAPGGDDPLHRHPGLHDHLRAPFAGGRGRHADRLLPAHERDRRAQQRRYRAVSGRFGLCHVERADSRSSTMCVPPAAAPWSSARRSTTSTPPPAWRAGRRW